MNKLRLLIIYALLAVPATAIQQQQQPEEQQSPQTQESTTRHHEEQIEGEVQPTPPEAQEPHPESAEEPAQVPPEEEPAQDSAQEPAEAPAAPERPPQPESGTATGLSFQFKNVPLTTVIETVMAELGYSYIIDPGVQGTASIYTMGEIPREEAFGVLERLLQMNGQAIVKEGDHYVILPLPQSTKIPHEVVVEEQPREPPPTPPARRSESEGGPEGSEPTPQQTPAPQGQAPAQTSGGAAQVPQPGAGQAEPVVATVPPPQQPEEGQQPEGVITYIIPLNFVPSNQMVQMITPFVSNGASVIDYASSNMVLVTDYRSNIEQVLKLVNLLDTQYFNINTVDLIPIRYNQAIDVATDLAQIFAPGDAAAGVRIVAIERLNSILVVTRSPAAFAEVKRWIEKLDARSTGSNVKTFVYQVENNTATNIAEVLSQLYQDGFGLPSGPTEGEAQQQPPPRQQEPGFVSPFERQFGGASRQLGPNLQGRPMSTQTGIRAVVSGNVKIIVNEFNNSLIIQATEADYQFLLETIRQLDVLPRQVLIDARIYSVELRDDLSFGVSAFLESRGATDPDSEAPLGPATTGQFTQEGLTLATRAIIGGARQLEAVINALRTKTNVEVLEAPRLLAVDGMQAEINVGAEVPVTTASFGDPIRSGVDTSFINSIQFRPTGTTLVIMPRVSASGVVTMDVAIEVSQATGTALTPTINRNFVTTSLIVRDGQTVAIGGIISDSVDFSRSRVPVVGDIPILGALFGRSDRMSRRAELIFFITPHVIRNFPTATELTLDFRRALRKAYDFIQEKEADENELIRKRREEELREH